MCRLNRSISNILSCLRSQKREIKKENPVGIAPYTVMAKGYKAYVTIWGGTRQIAKDLDRAFIRLPGVVDRKTGIASSGNCLVIDLATKK
jgi:hypothetical protein